MLQLPTVWVENSPETLLEITLKYCIKNQSAFTKYNRWKDEFQLLDGLSLPVGICERFLNISKAEMLEENFNKFINLFKDATRTHLRSLDLSDSYIDDRGLDILTKHSIVELNISNCNRLTSICLPYVTRLSKSLVSLSIGSSNNIFFGDKILRAPEKSSDHLLHHYMGLFQPQNENESSGNGDTDEDTSDVYLPNLRKLIINDLKEKMFPQLMNLINSASYLTYLDLSNCELTTKEMDCLSSQKHLTSLILCDVANVMQTFPLICKLKTLRFVLNI